MEYLLNGAPVRAESLSGASGALTMRISIAQGDEAYAAFYEHYALTMTVTLDGAKCKNLVAQDATIANSGEDRLLTYTILPSPEESYTITADVTDFSMPDIQINAVPLGMDVDIDTSQIDDQLSALQSGISQLDSGSSQVAGGAAQLQSGATTLAEGTDALVLGAQAFSAGLDETKAGSAQLAAASAQIVAAMEGFASHTGGADVSIAQLRNACEKLLAAVDALDDLLSGAGGDFGDISSAASTYVASCEQIASTISEMGFSSSDISLLETLLSRSSQSADVRNYLSAEIGALRRVLDNASAISGQLDALSACAQENLANANALAAQVSGLTAGISDARDQLDGMRVAGGDPCAA